MTVYSIAVANFVPYHPDSDRTLAFIKELEGLVGVHPAYPHGTLILFTTRKNAQSARKLIKQFGVQVGKNICELEVDDKYKP